MAPKLCVALIYFNIVVGFSAAIQFGNDEQRSMIIGGKTTSITSYPFAAAITVNDKVIGAGALLNSKYLITAASLKLLTKTKDIAIRVSSDDALTKGCELKVGKWINHPQYGGDVKNNLALIKFKNNIHSSCKTKSVSYKSYKLPKDGENTTVIGWGWGQNQTEQNKIAAARTPFLSFDNCKKIYPYYKNFTKTSFCTDGTSGPCQNDLGAPLIYKNVIIGLYSTSFVCGDPKLPTIYTDITKYYKWIRSIITK